MRPPPFHVWRGTNLFAFTKDCCLIFVYLTNQIFFQVETRSYCNQEKKMVNPREPNRTWFPGRTSALCKIGLYTIWHANVQLHTGLNISQAEFPRSILIKMKIPKPKWNENIKTSVTPRDPHRAHTIATLLSNQIACGTIESQIKQTNKHTIHASNLRSHVFSGNSIIKVTTREPHRTHIRATLLFEQNCLWHYWILMPEPQIKQTNKSFKYHPSHISSGNSKIKMTAREPHRARATATLLFEPIAAASC